ncbi:DUF3256 family protein [Parabacteroides bouchesdurhonensis]|uniref:DUF3256 family protein n=1 Tax=Parabacteroides bouchesdurhonensis TaxID=1936995 RepID=UPI000E49FB7A|nr:DUF3256 family protein [Parabacteroides bouchesdurhonensis]RHJ95371.1 DUF3256 family protein [Bacteroides sp. AM07-16]
MKRLILSILLCTFISGIKAQDIDALFAAMPDMYIPQLESAWRKDLIDLYNSGKEAQLKNTMNGVSSLKKLTSDYLLLQTTERSTVEMKLLPLVNKTNIICVVTTVDGPVSDSRIAFYTTDWQPLDTEDLLTPVSPEWFIREDADKDSEAYRNAVALLDMNLIKYTLSPDNLTLTETYMTPLYLNKSDREKVTPFLKTIPKVYTWEKSHFK